MKQTTTLKVVEINSIKVYLLNAKKYKTTCFSFRLSTLINRKMNDIISSLSYFLLSNTTHCKSKKEINRFLERMYDSKIYASNNNFGNISVLNFVLKTIDEKYTKEPHFFEKSLSFLVDILFGKYENKNQFLEENIEEEKINIIESMKLIKENKQDYAFQLLLRKMCQDENLSVFAFDKQQLIRSLTVMEVEEVYRYLIENASLDLIISGNFEDEEKILSLVKKCLPDYLTKREHLNVDINNSFKMVKKSRTYQKQIACNQAQIFLGYRTNIPYNSKEYYAQYLANAILGSFMNSKLFQIVREKHNLCYSTYSFLRPLDKCLFIYAGVDFTKIEKSIEVICEIIEDLKKRTISLKEEKLFKDLLLNSLREADDNQYNQIERAFSCEYTGKSFNIEDTIGKLEEVSAKDVLMYFQKIQLDTLFVLRGDQIEE